MRWVYFRRFSWPVVEDAEGKSGKASREYDYAMTTITVRGMSCGGCEQTVVDALEDLDGVTSASADRETESATVEGDASVDDLVAAVEDAGYEASA